jgi:hypothetical protein
MALLLPSLLLLLLTLLLLLLLLLVWSGMGGGCRQGLRPRGAAASGRRSGTSAAARSLLRGWRQLQQGPQAC